MRAEVQRLAQSAELAAADAERVRTSKSGRNAQAREKFLGSNWEFGDMASEAGSDGGRNVSVAQESLQWPEKRALAETQRALAKEEIVRKKQSWLQGSVEGVLKLQGEGYSDGRVDRMISHAGESNEVVEAHHHQR